MSNYQYPPLASHNSQSSERLIQQGSGHGMYPGTSLSGPRRMSNSSIGPGRSGYSSIPGPSNVTSVPMTGLRRPSESSLHMSAVQEEQLEQDDSDTPRRWDERPLSPHSPQVDQADALHRPLSSPPPYHEVVGTGLSLRQLDEAGIEIHQQHPDSQAAAWSTSGPSPSNYQFSSSPPSPPVLRGLQRPLPTPPCQSSTIDVRVPFTGDQSQSAPARTESFSVSDRLQVDDTIRVSRHRGSVSSSSENVHSSYYNEQSQAQRPRSGRDSGYSTGLSGSPGSRSGILSYSLSPEPQDITIASENRPDRPNRISTDSGIGSDRHRSMGRLGSTRRPSSIERTSTRSSDFSHGGGPISPTRFSTSNPRSRGEFIQLMLKRVTKSSQMGDLDPQGLTEIQRMREMPPHETAIFTLLEILWKQHTQFLSQSEKIGSKVLEILRGSVSPSVNASTSSAIGQGSGRSFELGRSSSTAEIIPRARVDGFVDTAFAGHISLLEVHSKFKLRLETQLRDFAKGHGNVTGSWVANEFLVHSKELMGRYRDHGESILEAPRLIHRESETNSAFRAFLRSPSASHDGRTFREVLSEYYHSPLNHITKYPSYIRICIARLPERSRWDREKLQEALISAERLVIDAQLLAWQITQGNDERYKITWNDLYLESEIPKVSAKEVERQTAIFDLIKGEMRWVRLLGLFRSVFVTPLESSVPHILGREQFQEFLDRVFQIQKRLYDRHVLLLEQLLTIQRQQVPAITELIKPSGLDKFDWRTAYEIEYATSVGSALDWLNEQMVRNAGFETFLNNASFNPEVPGQTIQQYLLGPKEYLHRTINRVERIRVNTTPGSGDQDTYLELLLDKLKRAYKACEQIRPAESNLSKFSQYFKWSRPGSEQDVDINHPYRKLLYEGEAWVSTTLCAGQQEFSHIFILDNCLLLTEPSEQDSDTYHNVTHRPVPLEALEQPGLRPAREAGRAYTNPAGGQSLATPVELRRKDRAEDFTIHVHSNEEAEKLKSALTNGIQQRVDFVEENHSYFLNKLAVEQCSRVPCTFRVPAPHSITILSNPPPSRGVTLSHPFQMNVPALTSLIGVQQIGMMQDLLIVLTTNAINIYKLDDIVKGKANPECQSLREDGEPKFFRVYQPDGDKRCALLVSRVNKQRYTVGIFLPCSQDEGHHNSLKILRNLRDRRALVRRRSSFQVAQECLDIVCLKSRIVILTREGFLQVTHDIFEFEGNISFEMVPLQLLPFPKDLRSNLVHKCRTSVPMTILRVSDTSRSDILLCYKEFGVFIDHHGRLTGRVVDWLGLHVDRVIPFPPYILVCSNRMVEVRESRSAKLLQVILLSPKSYVSWDGRDRVIGEAKKVECIHVVSPTRNDRYQVLEVSPQPASDPFVH